MKEKVFVNSSFETSLKSLKDSFNFMKLFVDILQNTHDFSLWNNIGLSKKLC